MRADNQDSSRVPLLISVGIHALLLILMGVGLSEKYPPRARISPLAVAYFKALQQNIRKTSRDSPNKAPVSKKRRHRENARADHEKIVEKEDLTTEDRLETTASLGNVLPSAHADIAIRPLPVLLNKDEVLVPYPDRAKLLHVEGVVKLRLTVAENGFVTKAEVLSGPAYGLTKAALEVAQQLHFLPATNTRGDAIVAQVEHDVVFKLHKI